MTAPDPRHRRRPHARRDGHFVITRLGIGVTDEDWYDHRLDLFEAVTFSSLTSQTTQDFHWMLVVDHEIPPRARRRLEDLIGARGNIHIVPVDVTALRRMTLGTNDWLWDVVQEHLLAEGLVDDVGDYVVTSIIDDDDAWNVGLVEHVNRVLFGQFVGSLPSADRIDAGFAGYLVSHGAGAALTFVTGMQWNVVDDRHSLLHYPWHSMSGFVVARLSSGVAATSARHDTIGLFAQVPLFQVAEADSTQPMWLYVRHPDAMSLQAQVDRYGPAAHATPEDLHATLRVRFGIDIDAVARYRRRWGDRRAAAAQTANVLGPHQRLDAQFRITALNRQIDTLDARLARGRSGDRAATERRRAAADAERRSLIAQLRGTRVTARGGAAG